MPRRAGAGRCDPHAVTRRPVVTLVASTLAHGTAPVTAVRAVSDCAPEVTVVAQIVTVIVARAAAGARTGCLDGKRIAYLDVSPTGHDGALAALSLSGTLSFPQTTIVARSSIAFPTARLKEGGGLIDRSPREPVGQVLRGLAPMAELDEMP